MCDAVSNICTGQGGTAAQCEEMWERLWDEFLFKCVLETDEFATVMCEDVLATGLELVYYETVPNM